MRQACECARPEPTLYKTPQSLQLRDFFLVRLSVLSLIKTRLSRRSISTPTNFPFIFPFHLSLHNPAGPTSLISMATGKRKRSPAPSLSGEMQSSSTGVSFAPFELCKPLDQIDPSRLDQSIEGLESHTQMTDLQVIVHFANPSRRQYDNRYCRWRKVIQLRLAYCCPD